MNFLLFLAPFSWGTQKREAAAPKASGCFMGGTCVVREEPGKQKTRRPERRGITRAVSPKKIGKERNECRNSRTADEEARRAIRCGSKRDNRHRTRSLLTSAASAKVIGSIKEEQCRKIATSTISRGNRHP
jgi:hypothetical protein